MTGQSFATLLRCQQDAVKEIGKAQHIQKKYYDAKHFKQDLAVGDKVLVKNSRRINRKGDKIMSKWVGPYTIAECVGKGVYKLEERKSKINRKSLKKFNTPTSTPSKEAFCNQKQTSTIQSLKKTSKRLKAQRNNLPTRTRRSRRELSNRSSKPSTKLERPQQSQRLTKPRRPSLITTPRPSLIKQPKPSLTKSRRPSLIKPPKPSLTKSTRPSLNKLRKPSLTKPPRPSLIKPPRHQSTIE